tara:strand:- start:109 stop:810 length:702 start_codon:yes stop_codon:yes gene_type:complete
MNDKDLLNAAKYEGQDLIALAEKNLTKKVPSCPEWDNSDLLLHITQVWLFVIAQLNSSNPEIRAPLTSHYSKDPKTILKSLIELLGAADPTTPVWTWTSNRTVRFFIRRMAHENTVHRWDAELAVGETSTIETKIANDGINEILEASIPYRLSNDSVEHPSGSLHLHQTDGDGEWLVSATGGNLQVTREHAKGDAAVRGTAENLFLYLWGRSNDDLEYFGDQKVIEAWAKVAP